VVGLYRNILVWHPNTTVFNLEPASDARLNGHAFFNYEHPGKNITLVLASMTMQWGLIISRCAPEAFAINVTAYTDTSRSEPDCGTGDYNCLCRAVGADHSLWPEAGKRRWTESSGKGGVIARRIISSLAPNTQYQVSRNGCTAGSTPQ